VEQKTQKLIIFEHKLKFFAPMKNVKIPQQVLFDQYGNFGFITRKSSKNITVDELPLNVLLTDKFEQTYPAQLILVIPFTNILPEVLTQLCMGLDAETAFEQITARTETTSINELAFYLYKYTRP
jgi:hypothetical protein